MKIVQKVLSHGLLITFFIAVFLIYFYRAELFPQWFAAQNVEQPEQTAASAVPAPVVSAPVTTSKPQTPVEETPTAGTGQAGIPAIDDPAEAQTGAVAPQEPAHAQPGESLPDKPAGSAALTDASQPAAGTVQESTASASSVDQTALAPSAEPSPPPPEEPLAPQVESRVSDASLEQQLKAARELYWKNDAAGAEKAYSAITAAHPDRADAWGELGNVYFNLGRWNEAADAYYRAANLLIDQGQPQRAASMLRVLHGLDSGKGGEIEERLKTDGVL